MSKYEYLMGQHDMCIEIATLYAQAGDVNLSEFYFNAALGYKIKAGQITVGEMEVSGGW